MDSLASMLTTPLSFWLAFLLIVLDLLIFAPSACCTTISMRSTRKSATLALHDPRLAGGWSDIVAAETAHPGRSTDRLSSPSIVIEPLLQRSKLRWQVSMGRRSLIFHQEQAARAFAAQLHVRLLWLRKSAETESQDSSSPA